MAEQAVVERPSRLMITHMVLENFKSYAGEQEIGPFHKRFSSVVGPNGSGKSNVIDALLFVFGKKAKQLRLNKVSELIHKSSGFPNLEYARVAVHFQRIYDDEASADAFEIVPDSLFVVTRTAYKDNTSTYTINGKSANFAAVAKLLITHGIDLDNNRFLILQGEVEQIAMMKPKGAVKHEDGLLEYLEDIIGSNCFVDRIEEMSKQLEEMNELRTEKVNRLKVAEKDRDNLSDSKAEAEAFISKEKEIRKKKNVLYQVYEKIALDNVEKYTFIQSELAEKLHAEQAKISESESVLTVKDVAYKAATKEYDEVSKQADEATNDFGALERQDVKIREDMKHNKDQLKKVNASIEGFSVKERDSTLEAERACEEKDKLRKDLSEVEEKKNAEEQTVVEVMASLQEATLELRGQLETAQEKVASAERDVAEFQTEKESISTELSLIKSRATNASASLAKLLEKRSTFASERDSTHARIAGAETEKDNASRSVSILEAKFKMHESEEEKLQNAVRAAISASEEGKAAMASAGRSTGVHSAIMKASQRGGPLAGAGICGRLGDLGTIPAEYDAAISTACSYLDYIVTNSTEGAQSCMQFLRAQNLGRASFIALDKMSDSAGRMHRAIDVPSVAIRIFDTIKPAEERFLPAFYFAIKDTLVVEDLDTATSIAYEGDVAKWRVVTRTGNMIDTSGAMSGGGNSSKKGLMLLEGSMKALSSKAAAELPSITLQEVQQLEARVLDTQKALKACRAAKETIEAEIKESHKKVKSLSNEIAKLQMALSNVREKEQALLERIPALERECNLSPDEVRDIQLQEAKLSEIEKQIFEASPHIGSYRSAVSSLQRKIMDVGGPKVARAQQKLDILTKNYDALFNKLAGIELAETTARANATKAAASREKSEAELAKVQKKSEGLADALKSMEADAMNAINKLQHAKTRMAEQEEALRVITADFKQISAEHTAMKKVEMELKNDVSSAVKKLEQETYDYKRWQKDLNDLRAKHISEQEQFFAAVAACIGEQPASGLTTELPTSAMPIQDRVGAGGVEVLTVFSPDALLAWQPNCSEIKSEIAQLEADKQAMEMNVNMGALLEYMKKDAFYRTRFAELEVITEARNTVRRDYEDLRRQRLEMFMSGFGIITLKLKEMYQMITLGGDAELELVDSLDPFSEGIVFSVRPPKKSWKNISNLSGGEKTLSSLALVFALHHFKPTALYVMDEIDAALDFKNVSIVANYIKERTKNAQFVIISLRNNMFELADRLVGIYKTNDATKSVTINPRSFEDATAGKKITEKSAATVPRKILGDATNML